MSANPSSQRWVAIVNAAAGSRDDGRWQSVERALHAAGVEFDAVATGQSGHGEALAIEALHAGRRRLMVAGGDGSIHDVVNGVMGARLAGDDRVALAIVPIGTGNDLARTLGVPAEPTAIAAALRLGRVRPHDVGELRFEAGPDGPPAPRWFANVAGVGFDAHVLSRLRGRTASRHAYLRSALLQLAPYVSSRYQVTADAEVTQGRLLACFAAIGAYCGGGMNIAPGARPDDGLLDLVAIRDPGVFGVLRRLPKLYDGRLLGDDAVSHRRCREIEIDAIPGQPVEADGQVLGTTPVRITIHHKALDFVRS